MKKAVAWLTRSAVNRNADGAYALAEIYEQGKDGIPPDMERAVYWYQRSSSMGSRWGMFKYVSLMKNGRRYKYNQQKVTEWETIPDMPD